MGKAVTSFLAAAALVLAAAPTLVAQDGPRFVQVEEFDVSPGTAPQFEAAIAKAVEAANQASLAGEFGWSTYQDGSKYHIVTWHQSMGNLDDEMLWQRQFVGTPGEALLGEAFAMFAEVQASGSSHIAEAVPEWTYEPENGLDGDDAVGAVVFRDWVEFSQQEAFDANTKELIALLGEMDFPYPVYGHRVRVGDIGQCYFVVLHDGLDHFYGDKSIEKFIEAAGVGEKWGTAMQARGPMMRSTDSFNVAYREDLSYHR
ncbi:MAG: hypothetical protein ACE5HP_12825 [Gemmatimonadota bacterium]